EEMQRQEVEKAMEEDRQREAALQTLLAEKEREKEREMEKERKAEADRREAEEAATAAATARKAAAAMPDPQLAAVKQLERKSSVSSISSGTPSVVPSISSARSKSVSSSFGPTLHRRKSVVSVKATAPTQRSGFGFSFFSRKNQSSEPNLPPSAAPSPSPMLHNNNNSRHNLPVNASPAPSLIPGSALSPDSPGSLSRETPLSLARDVSVKSNSGNARSSTLSMNVPSPRMSVMSEADTVRMSNRDSSASTIKIESRISRSYAESPKLEVMLPSEDEKDLFEFKF
ncbi:hypothetical protein HDU80_003022, partial [Chytriomyces hyalinus]